MHKNGAKMFWRQKAPWHALYRRPCRLQYCDFTRWVSATNNNSTFYFIENLPTRIWIRSFMFYLYCITFWVVERPFANVWIRKQWPIVKYLQFLAFSFYIKYKAIFCVIRILILKEYLKPWLLLHMLYWIQYKLTVTWTCIIECPLTSNFSGKHPV